MGEVFENSFIIISLYYYTASISREEKECTPGIHNLYFVCSMAALIFLFVLWRH